VRAPEAGRGARWYDPRGRHLGAWAFTISRVSALGLSSTSTCTWSC